MRLLFAGTPEVALPSLDALLKSRHEVAAVITRPDAPAGRGRRVGPSPVAERAAEVGLEVLKPPTPRDEGFLDHLRALKEMGLEGAIVGRALYSGDINKDRTIDASDFLQLDPVIQKLIYK